MLCSLQISSTWVRYSSTVLLPYLVFTSKDAASSTSLPKRYLSKSQQSTKLATCTPAPCTAEKAAPSSKGNNIDRTLL